MRAAVHELVLFLDFDGVLSPGLTGTLRDAPALAAVLEEFPQARLVLSTNWRELEDLRGLCKWLPDDLAARVLDATPRMPYGEERGGRQREIELWLQRNPTKHKLAMDDSADLFEPGCPWLFLTDSRRALDRDTLVELRQRLLAFTRLEEVDPSGILALYRKC